MEEGNALFLFLFSPSESGWYELGDFTFILFVIFGLTYLTVFKINLIAFE